MLWCPMVVKGICRIQPKSTEWNLAPIELSLAKKHYYLRRLFIDANKSAFPEWSQMKEQECKEYLESKAVRYNAVMSAVELKQIVKRYIKVNEKPEIVHLPQLAGHEVLFTLPYLVTLHLSSCVGLALKNSFVHFQKALQAVSDWLLVMIVVTK